MTDITEDDLTWVIRRINAIRGAARGNNPVKVYEEAGKLMEWAVDVREEKTDE